LVPGEIGFPDAVTHSFRHFFVSEAFSAGATESEVMSWVGHRDSRIVRRYRHLRPSTNNHVLPKITITGNSKTRRPSAPHNKHDQTSFTNSAYPQWTIRCDAGLHRGITPKMDVVKSKTGTHIEPASTPPFVPVPVPVTGTNEIAPCNQLYFQGLQGAVGGQRRGRDSLPGSPAAYNAVCKPENSGDSV
jgi:hypothetical protein